MQPIHIETGTVQETLLIPLYGRKMCTERFPSIYTDTAAAELCARLDYDFSHLDKKAKGTLFQFGALEAAMRQLDMEWEIRDYLRTHPNAAIVNMGCGLDQTGKSCDNGTCRIYNIDFPDIIALREELIPPGEREKNIPCDLLDTAWQEEIDGSQGVVLFAAGVFHYFTTEQAKTLTGALAAKFPAGRLIFDTVNKRGRDIMMKTVLRNMKMQNVQGFLYVNDIKKDLAGWAVGSSVSARGYMLGYYDLKLPEIRGLYRFLAKICDGLLGMQIIRMDFAP